MRKSLRLAAGALAISAAIAGAGTAHADGSLGDQSATAFAQELADASGLQWYPNKAQSLAGVVCRRLANGESESQVEASMRQSPFGGPAFGNAWTVIVPGAEFHFCPSYYHTS
jgi:Protein of unknown function (DUF732)